jgi:GT2 family glycosyltransferase
MANLLNEKCVLVSGPKAPNDAEWAYVAEVWKPSPEEPAVDVIVPAYRGFDETLRCLHSVLAAPQVTPHRLVVVDDQGPDPELRDALRRLAARGWIELHVTPENLGFVGACNLGLRLHPDRDVVLLNSDTEVHNDWLDRLRRAALRGLRTGSVTPFSNNATICSYPRFGSDNCRVLELGDVELDRLAAAINAGTEVEIPTGVGFCMYIRRACLNEVGLLDMANFGRGYGEENDFCRRAVAAGWQNILAGDVFVRHYGGVSFGAEKLDRELGALQKACTRDIWTWSLPSAATTRLARCGRPSTWRASPAAPGHKARSCSSPPNWEAAPSAMLRNLLACSRRKGWQFFGVVPIRTIPAGCG